MHEFSSTLKKVPLFNDFSEQEIDEIAHLFKLLRLRNNVEVLHFNEEGNLLYILKYGQVKVLIPDESGEADQVVATLGPGNYFGEMSLMTGEPVSATVKTSLDSEFLTLDKDTFNTLLRKYSKLSYKISMILSKRLRERNIFQKSRVLPEKVSVFADDDATAAKISFLLGLSLYLEGMDRVLIIDLQSIEHDYIHYFGFDEAQEKLDKYITTHDIGEELKSIHGTLHEYAHMDAIAGKSGHRQTVSYASRDKSRIAGKSYTYIPGVFVLQVRDNEDENTPMIKPDHIPPLLSLVSEIYDVIVLAVGSKVNPMIAKALSQTDMCLFVGEKKPDALQSLGQKTVEIAKLEPWQFESSTIALFSENKKNPLTFKEIQDLFQLENTVIRNFPSSKQHFLQPGLAPDNQFVSNGIRRIISSMAREITGKTIGIALGGGGARGYAHIGVLKILEQEGFPIDIVSGSSMGSLIAATFCMTGSAKETEQIIRKELAEYPSIFDFTIPVHSFVRGKRIARIAKNIFGDATFSDMIIPLYIVCVDLITGNEIVINDGPVHQAVMASSAIPGIFKPVKWRDTYLVDGSVINKVPANVLSYYKADLVISVNVTPDKEHFAKKQDERKHFFTALLRNSKLFKSLFEEPRIFQIITRSLNITNAQMSRVGAQFTNFEIKPSIEQFDFLNFKQFDPIVQAGEVAARDSIESLKNVILAIK